MSNFITDMFAGGAKGLVDGVRDLADTFIQTADEKSAFALDVEKLVTQRMAMMEESARTTVGARMQIIVAELQHGDPYTKRTRPMIARWGLYTVIWNHAIVPTLGGLVQFCVATWVSVEAAAHINVAPIELPTEFWIAWGGIVSTWAVGRSFEKFGVNNKATRTLTGNTSPSRIADRILDG